MANLDLLNEFWTRTEREDEFRNYRDFVRQARAFTLDDDLAGVVSKLGARADDKTLLRYKHAARLPYPKMWIEGSFEHLFADNGSSRHMFGRPERVGWMLKQGDEVYGPDVIQAIRVARTDGGGPLAGGDLLASVYPAIFRWFPEGRIDYRPIRLRDGNAAATKWFEELVAAEQDFNSHSASMRLAWTPNDPGVERQIGVDAMELLRRASQETDRLPLAGQAVVSMEGRALDALVRRNTYPTLTEGVKELLGAALYDQTGDLGLIVSALALINEIPIRRIEYQPRGSVRAGGRIRPYMRSTIVSIEVPANRRRVKDIEKTIKLRVEAAKRARHEVRGHWLTSDKPPRAEETREEKRWETYFDRHGKLRWRTWIANHMRGSAEIGFVQHVYEVTENPRKKAVDNSLSGL
ncbi:hypothetical protein CcrBL47_gp326 [Caulobacter phage BL47]|nr:hypothetical protein CcrBL47_gp326 [Caulobacter phage BL47]